jgi:hypothetical protein
MRSQLTNKQMTSKIFQRISFFLIKKKENSPKINYQVFMYDSHYLRLRVQRRMAARNMNAPTTMQAGPSTLEFSVTSTRSS